ncbi:expressed unknown protein [Seminavis robusta]|uniref:Uncharacterized protein n=1 Tax=Seminavis robusta TaxID=568900 RepID=A0A9N8HTB1_9STRA|nr:expressed unknown protein [Seminavis robusta]|eukprot:Sro1638_g287750.1 n/a (286) ;mRNA; r:10535-11392
MHGCDETKDESDNHLKHSWSRIATLLTRLFVMILSNILWFASEGIQTLLSRIKTSPHMTFVYTAGMDTRKTLAEVDAWKSMAWEKIQKYNEASQFELDFGKGNIHEAMRRLERAKPDNNKEAEAYASKWAKALNPKNVNQQGLVEANQLDADRKVCLEFLYRLYNCCCVPETKELDPAKVTSVVQEFDRGRRIVDMLYLLLVFDRAKSIHFNKDHQTGTRGMHWYAKKHQNRPEWKASNPSGATINKRLVWFVDDHLKIASKHGPNGWLWELMEPAEREADENDS